MAPAASAATQDVHGNLLAPEGLTANGHLQTSTDQASLDLQGASVASSLVLTAARLEINFSWEQGIDASPPGHPAIVQQVEDSGNQTLVFENATVDLLDPVEDHAQVVAFTDLPTARFSTTSPITYLGLVQDPRVAGAGSSQENTKSDGAPPVGFHHDLEGPHVALQASTHARVTGSFEVFVNNLTLSVTHDHGTWENWTGYREQNATPSDPTQTGTVPSTLRTYERHVATLEVYRGQLTTDQRVPSDLYAPRVAADLEGAIHTFTAYGSLTTPSGAVTLDGVPLNLIGTGTLDLSVTTPRAVEGPAPPGEAPILNATTDGDFAVASGRPLTPAGEDTGQGGLLAALPTVPWSLLPVALVLALAGVVTFPWTSSGTRTLYHRWRRKLFIQRFEHARTLSSRGNEPGARKALQQAARWVPDDGEAIFALADAQSMAGDQEGALATLDRADEREVWIYPVKELELRVICCNQLEQHDHAVEALTDLERISHPMAVDLVCDLQLWHLAEQVEGLRELASEEPEPTGGFDGYV